MSQKATGALKGGSRTSEAAECHSLVASVQPATVCYAVVIFSRRRSRAGHNVRSLPLCQVNEVATARLVKARTHIALCRSYLSIPAGLLIHFRAATCNSRKQLLYKEDANAYSDSLTKLPRLVSISFTVSALLSSPGATLPSPPRGTAAPSSTPFGGSESTRSSISVIESPTPSSGSPTELMAIRQIIMLLARPLRMLLVGILCSQSAQLLVEIALTADNPNAGMR